MFFPCHSCFYLFLPDEFFSTAIITIGAPMSEVTAFTGEHIPEYRLFCHEAAYERYDASCNDRKRYECTPVGASGKISLTICGTASPMKATGPQYAVTVPASRAVSSIFSSLPCAYVHAEVAGVVLTEQKGR